MITILIAAMLGGADPGAARIHDFNQCLHQAASDAETQKVTPELFTAFLRGHCATAEAPYKASLVIEDVKHGMSRKEAVSDAASIIASYYSDRLDNYKLIYKHTEQAASDSTPPAQPKVTPAPTPAAQPK